MRNLSNYQIYLDRMAKPLAEKLKIIKYLPKETTSVVDVGCADGAITIEMAKIFPEIKFLGIDLDKNFIELAKSKAKNIPNVTFEQIYLRDLLARPERYEAVTFLSVLHEFFTYGEGISSVLKAVSDAHELLNDQGVILIRDMILFEYTKTATLRVPEIILKIRKNKNYSSYLTDFENRFGKLNCLHRINHFLLKYWYTENWKMEGKEYYVPVTIEEYNEIFKLLGTVLQHQESYMIPYLSQKWQEDFGLDEGELSELKSTTILCAQKKVRSY